MVDIKAKIIPESQAYSVLDISRGAESARAFVGSGNDNYVCGNCGQILAEKVGKGELMRMCVKCRCGSFNLIQ
jgi:hypothetical protein